MKKSIWCLLVATTLCISSSMEAQERYTIADMTPGSSAYWSHLPQLPHILGVTDEGVLTIDEEGLWVKRGETKQLLLSQERWSEATGETSPPTLTPHGTSGLLKWRQKERLILWSPKDSTIRYDYHFSSNDWDEYKISPKGDYIVLLNQEGFATLKPDGTLEVVIDDGNFDIQYGRSVHRNEFGISGGIFFSPTGRYFAFYRNDQSDVTAYPIVTIQHPIATHRPIKYPMAGSISERVTVGIYDTESGEVRYLETGAPTDRYFTNLAWAPDESHLYIDEVNRGQDRLQLIAYDVQSGRPERTILKEQNDKYIEPDTPILFNKSGDTFIRLSRVDGQRHLYLHYRDGRAPLQLTKGDWEVKELLGWDAQEEWIYFVSNKDYTIGQDLYRISTKGGAPQRISSTEGWSSAQLSPQKGLAYITTSSKELPGQAELIDLQSSTPIVLSKQMAEDPDRDYLRPVVEVGSLKASDGSDLYYKMTLPPDYKDGAQYPVILYVYGGPHSQLVTDTWRSLRMGWDIFMAQEGYIVFTIDNRGTANRGMAFESATFMQLGKVEMEDQMVGIDYLRSLPFVDNDRIGVYGWSFGGFMATNLMLTYPEVFKVGVAGGPVMDWRYYEVMYGERYMDKPEENPEGYKASNLISRAGDLEGRLLLIHGAIDPVVVWQHSLLFMDAAVKAGTYPDYMVYPAHEHNVRGEDRVHLHTVITRYFNDFLK